MDWTFENYNRHPRLGGPNVRYKFGGGGSAPKAAVVAPAPSPVPRRVEVDVAAAEKEQREIAGRRRSRLRTVLTRELDFGRAETSRAELLGL